MRCSYLIAALIPAMAAAEEMSSRKQLGMSSSNPLVRRDTCSSIGQVACDDSCKPSSAVCCNDGSGTFCDAGYYCDTDGCCPTGKHCTGGGGTLTYPVFGTSIPTNTALNNFGSGSNTSPSGAGITTHASGPRPGVAGHAVTVGAMPAIAAGAVAAGMAWL